MLAAATSELNLALCFSPPALAFSPRAQSKALVEAWKEKGFDKDKVEVVIAPTALHLGSVKGGLEGLGMQVSSQNVGKNDMGAFTGEWTAVHLQDMEVPYTLIGHSERRSKYGESDEDTAVKVEKCQAAGIKVIFCIGELLEEREAGKTDEVNKRQLAAVIPKIKDWDKIVIAYEPVWAIGTGKVATPEQAEETQANIRAYLKEAVSAEVADKACCNKLGLFFVYLVSAFLLDTWAKKINVSSRAGAYDASFLGGKCLCFLIVFRANSSYKRYWVEFYSNLRSLVMLACGLFRGYYDGELDDYDKWRLNWDRMRLRTLMTEEEFGEVDRAIHVEETHEELWASFVSGSFLVSMEPSYRQLLVIINFLLMSIKLHANEPYGFKERFLPEFIKMSTMLMRSQDRATWQHVNTALCTPLPLPYVNLVRLLLSLYLLSVVFYIQHEAEKGTGQENPFGDDANDLDVQECSKPWQWYVAVKSQVSGVHMHNLNAKTGTYVRIQYGGSVTPDNCKELITKPNIDGFLVGGASLKPTFMDIVTACQG
ncbi:Triosephosphate isomerase [Symbiodinium microadriaticum]|uniref:Triosephosphate isomerase n=1 Tax=Symbiodinium microadriaticum TaxID=2951 RepID=A0A1Q9CPV2_SYMMI|nr:Triosephosphate isomerase [Symbiodinium microadriaticum]